MPSRVIEAAEEMMAGDFTQSDIMENYSLTEEEFQVAYDMACAELGYSV